MAYTKFMITCMLHFRESYPESCPRIIPANHTTNHTHDFGKGGRNIPRNIPPKHTSETYLESYPLMQHALLGTEFSERAICTYINYIILYPCQVHDFYSGFEWHALDNRTMPAPWGGLVHAGNLGTRIPDGSKIRENHLGCKNLMHNGILPHTTNLNWCRISAINLYHLNYPPGH